jgi:hypothetical protein
MRNDEEMWERVYTDEQRLTARLQVLRCEVQRCEERLRNIQIFRAVFEIYRDPSDDDELSPRPRMSPIEHTAEPRSPFDPSHPNEIRSDDLDRDAWLRRLLNLGNEPHA